MSAAELQGLQDAGRGPARSGSRLGQNEYGRVMEVGASNRQPLRRGTPGRLNPWLQIAVRAVSWFAFLELFDRLFAFRLTAYSVQLSVSSDLPSIALMLGIIVVGLVVARATVRLHDTPTRRAACPTATES